MQAFFRGRREDDLLSLSAADRAAVLLEALLAVALAALFFFRSALAAAVLLPLVYPVCLRRERAIREKRRAELLAQFGELTQSLITALKAGYSPENAFHEATADMTFLCGENSMIVRELTRIERGMSGNIPLEQLLMSFALRSGLAEVREFAEVFAIAKRSGGSMVKILDRTAGLIAERIDLEQEIGVMLSARRLEQRIMDVVPFVIIAYISISSRGFFDVLYHNPVGIGVMAACLAAYLGAFALSEKIMDIQV